MSLLTLLTILHVLGAAVGVGAATVSDSLFLRSMRNRTISSDQFSLLHACSRVVLAGLVVVVLSGLVLLLEDVSLLSEPYFQLKMTAVFVLMLTGLVFHLWTLPFLRSRRDTDMKAALPGWRLSVFAFKGSCSVVSWYASIIIAVGSWAEPGYAVLLSLYIGSIVAASLGAYGVLQWRLRTATPKPDHQPQPRRLVGVRWDALLIALLLLVFVIVLAAALLRQG